MLLLGFRSGTSSQRGASRYAPLPGTSHSGPGPARPGPARSPTPTSTRSPSPGGSQTFIPEALPLPAPSPSPSTPPDTPDSVFHTHSPLWTSLRLMQPLG